MQKLPTLYVSPAPLCDHAQVYHFTGQQLLAVLLKVLLGLKTYFSRFIGSETGSDGSRTFLLR